MVYQGAPAGLATMKTPSTTARMLTRSEALRPVPRRRKPSGMIVVRGAGENNLKKVDAEFGRGVLNVVTGVSGSGKSTLVVDTLVRGIQRKRGEAVKRAGVHESIEGEKGIGSVILIDQSPVGKLRARAQPRT